jgi:hypothetical protein
MSRSLHPPESGNINATLAEAGPKESPLLGKQFPCCVCGLGLEIRFTRKKIPSLIQPASLAGFRFFSEGKLRSSV